ncbi:MAG: DUF4974 domain-containing protein [Odoribacter sp.]|nr:DUF4974 domain-containing protein [Odoribacter sp.]
MDTKEREIFRLAEVIARSMREELSADEKKELEEWLAQNERHRKLYASFQEDETLIKQTLLHQSIDWQKACRQFLLRRSERRRHRLAVRFSRCAAMACLLFAIGAAWWLQREDTVLENTIKEVVSIHPKALLTLESGRQIVLSEHDTSISIASQKGAHIEILENQLTYSVEPTTIEHIPCNTLETPRGGEYLVTLSDGTRVWLNAASQLRYPVKFTGKQRTVYLLGEAYFEVAPDSLHPFTIISGPAEITVLGTSFNLHAYPEEDIVTTLVSGAVQMTEKVGGQSVQLMPGEQGRLEKTNGSIFKQEVDTRLYTSWKEGRIVFRDMRLEDLFTTLARWYDLEVFYLHPAAKDIRFTGNIDKTERFEDILHIIEQNRRVHFKVNGHAVSITLP